MPAHAVRFGCILAALILAATAVLSDTIPGGWGDVDTSEPAHHDSPVAASDPEVLAPSEREIVDAAWRPGVFVVYIDHNKVDHFEILFSVLAHIRSEDAVPHTPNRSLPVPRGDGANVRVHVNPTHLTSRRMKLLRSVGVELHFVRPWRYDLRVASTFYPRRTDKCTWCYPDALQLADRRSSPTEVLISHLVPSADELAGWDNVWYVTPLGQPFILPTYFPFPSARPFPPAPGETPVFLVQGSLSGSRRNYAALSEVLERHGDRKSFVLKLVGKVGKEGPPAFVQKWRKRGVIELVQNSDDEGYHKAVSLSHVILPLVDESYQHSYFSTKLTSSVTYGLGFKLRFVAHRRLQQIYNLPEDGNWFYNRSSEFVSAFGAALEAATGGSKSG